MNLRSNTAGGRESENGAGVAGSFCSSAVRWQWSKGVRPFVVGTIGS